jgi:anti-anti-sigma factor
MAWLTRRQRKHQPGRVSAGLEIQARVSGAKHVLRLRGALDATEGARLRQEVARRAVEAETITLDLREVSFLACGGLAAILDCNGVCTRGGCGFALVPGPEHVQRRFELTGLLTRLPFLAGEHSS